MAARLRNEPSTVGIERGRIFDPDGLLGMMFRDVSQGIGDRRCLTWPEQGGDESGRIPVSQSCEIGRSDGLRAAPDMEPARQETDRREQPRRVSV